MSRKTFSVAAACLAGLFFQNADARGEIPGVRVYPVPQRLELTGGVSTASPAGTRFREVDGLGDEGYRIVVDKAVSDYPRRLFPR